MHLSLAGSTACLPEAEVPQDLEPSLVSPAYPSWECCQVKGLLFFSSPKVTAGIVSAVILFVAVVATTLCCFFCTCRYLSRRRQRLQSPFAGRDSAGHESRGGLG